MVLTRLTLFHFVTSHSFSDEALSSLKDQLSSEELRTDLGWPAFLTINSWLTPFDTVSQFELVSAYSRVLSLRTGQQGLAGNGSVI